MSADQICLAGIPRVLFIDNDPGTRQINQDLLAYWSCQPILATGEGKALLEDAIQKARQYRCQLALVDMRLRDHTDDDDYSGLELIPQLVPTQVIVFSAFANKATAFRMAMEKGALSLVDKADGPLDLKIELEKALQKLCAQRSSILIESRQVIEQIAAILATNHATFLKDQVLDTLVRLFPKASHLQLEFLDQGLSPPSLTSVPRPRSAILKVVEDDRQPVIVKLGRAHKLQKEVSNYEDHIRGYLVGFFHPQLQTSAVLWDVGGAIYSHLGSSANVQTFSQFYASASIPEIQHCLEQFFSTTWSALYRNTCEWQKTTAFRAYSDVWGNNWYDERICSFSAPEIRNAMGVEQGKILGARDPIAWLKEHVLAETENPQATLEDVKFAVTHGDLHGDNLLIDDKHNAWVIDYERSGKGPILQDFVELEADILTRLTHGADFQTFYQLCIHVARPQRLDACLDGDQIHSHQPPSGNFNKELKIIAVLRGLAREMTGIEDTRQYLLGLLYNTLFRATIIDSQLDLAQYHRVMMLASIICHRLDHWDKPWPPSNWPLIKTSPYPPER
ncbi:MAG: phosphotransferase [Anaerolineales bacterium]|nr:phosphotransferase [Anaerolineales bacterium]